MMRPRKFEYLLSIRAFYKSNFEDLNVNVNSSRRLHSGKAIQDVHNMIKKDLNAEKLIINHIHLIREKRAL
ncbi:hypothetical protein [Bacillus cereus group sp. MG11]|uniref:hypothetical protein n=1 Tax=Bacillus cereus group sp. MG11 TaxID=3040248 RepID=UPI003390F0BD